MGFDTSLIDRRSALGTLLAGMGALALPATSSSGSQSPTELTVEDIATLERAQGLSFTAEERKAILASVKQQRSVIEGIRGLSIPNSVGPAFVFHPVGKQPVSGKGVDVRTRPMGGKPSTDEDMAFMSVVDLATKIRRKEISSVELTRLYLSRLETHGPKLLNVISLTAERALLQAKKLDEELARGKYRGPLHGIPCGIKDLFAMKGYPTTWGAEPFQRQTFDEDCAVVEKLELAGAVICAKLSLGALAMNDHWFSGRTLNPWDRSQGSSGSSAGSASAMAAGLVAFTIGTETLGSIMSPSQRCRVTGLRPTFGRISRHGAMALSWTMDKVGPICRTAQDCAVVLAALQGADPRDGSSVDRPLRFRPDVDLAKLKIGYLESDRGFEDPKGGLALLRKLGAKPIPIKLGVQTRGAEGVLSVEAAAAFDEITRSGAVNTISSSSWPGIFRANRFVAGVEYIQQMRARSMVMEQFEADFGDFDAIVASNRGDSLLVVTNLTGHPQVYIPLGVNDRNAPRGVSIFGRLYDEGTILGVGARLQMATEYWKERPTL